MTRPTRSWVLRVTAGWLITSLSHTAGQHCSSEVHIVWEEDPTHFLLSESSFLTHILMFYQVQDLTCPVVQFNCSTHVLIHSVVKVKDW